MKTLKEIFGSPTIYLEEFTKKEDLEYQFDTKLDENIRILYAFYEQANYEGYAFVLFEKEGELYEVNGSHCSCFGLEGQWQPEEVITTELEHRLTTGTFGDDAGFRESLKSFLNI